MLMFFKANEIGHLYKMVSVLAIVCSQHSFSLYTSLYGDISRGHNISMLSHIYMVTTARMDCNNVLTHD